MSGAGRLFAGFSSGLQIAALVLFFAVICLAWLAVQRRGSSGREEPPDSASERRATTGFWWLGLLLVLLPVAALNIIVDPYGMYGSGVMGPVSMQMRRLKAEAYAALPEPPVVVVLGSSVAHSISPGTLREQLGVTAFSAAVGGGRVDDFLVQTKFMRSTQNGRIPMVFFVQLDPRLRWGGVQSAELTPLSMLPYMRPTTALLALRRRASHSIGRKQTSDSLYVLRAGRARGPGSVAREIDRDGQILRLEKARRSKPMARGRFDRRMDRFIRRAKRERRPSGCPELDPRAVRDLDEFLRLTSANGASVVFYLSPPHPRYRQEVHLAATSYQHCRSLTTAHLRRLAAADEAVDFLDLTLLESIGGDDSAAGYTDPYHLTPANGDRIIAAAAATLSAAIDRATRPQTAGGAG